MLKDLNFVPDTFEKGGLRLCEVNGKRAYFHKWGVVGMSSPREVTVGIVEYQDGTVHECYPYEIRFCLPPDQYLTWISPEEAQKYIKDMVKKFKRNGEEGSTTNG